MTNLAHQRDQAVQAAYATRADFCQIFQHGMKPFYLLAFLLTADHAKAEECFVTGIADVVEGNAVFKEWAHSWSRRAIIKNALRILSPMSSQPEASRDLWHEAHSMAGHAIDAVTRLAPLERCVFVMSVLEQYPDAECTALLSCTRQDIARARIRALQSLANEPAIPEAVVEASRLSRDSVHLVA